VHEETGSLDHPALRRVVAVLSATQITSWGVLYYAFPVLAVSITGDTGWTLPQVTAAFSLSLLVAAVGGIVVGRVIDRTGPRRVMTLGSLLAVPAVLAVAAAPSYPLFLLAWTVVGAATSALLYPPAFAALTRWGGARRVRALTILTLVAGLSSTIFAPLTAALEGWLGWRQTYVVLAGVLAVVTVPAHWFGLRHPWPADGTAPGADRPRLPGSRTVSIRRSRSFVVLVVAMTSASLCVYAAVINLVPLLTARGLTAGEAATALGLGGVGQVCGRLGYAWFASRTSVAVRNATVFGAVAVTTVLLAAAPPVLGLLLLASVLAGAARGMFTLVQATAVSDRWGVAGYATLNGLVSAPVMAATAAAPWVGSLLAATVGGQREGFAVLAGLAVLAAALIPWSRPPGQAPGQAEEPTR
jgi:MFS family permease